MIGRRIASRPALPWWPLFTIGGGLVLLVAGRAVGSRPAAIAAVLPLAVGVSAWVLDRPRRFAATLTEEAIALEHPAETVPYAALRNIWADGAPLDPATFRKRAAPILVRHDAGVIRIPARLDVGSDELCRFLAGRVPPTGGRDVNPALEEYLTHSEARHGAESVWTYRAATRRFRGRIRWLRAFSLGLMLAGVGWTAIGFSGRGEEGWGFGGIGCATLGLLFFLASFGEEGLGGRVVKRWKKASLVIGPEGMAMVQGDVEGVVRWPELLDVQFRPRPRSFQFSGAANQRGIVLRVQGAEIVIADIYDRPLFVIYERIMSASGRSAPRAPVA